MVMGDGAWGFPEMAPQCAPVTLHPHIFRPVPLAILLDFPAAWQYNQSNNYTRVDWRALKWLDGVDV